MVASNIFFKISPLLLGEEHHPFLTSIFFRWVGSTTNDPWMWPRFAALSQLGFELFGSAEVEGAWRRPSQVLHKCLTTMLGPGAGCLWRHWSPVVFSCLNHCFGTFVTDVQTCDDVRVQSATKLTASVLGGGGDDNVPCTYTHVGCYATHGWAGGGDVIKWRNLGQSGCSTSALQIISFRGSRPALLCLAGHAQEPTGLPALYNRVSHLCAFAMSFMAGTYLFHGIGLHASSASRSRTPAATMFVSLLPSGCTAVWFFLFRFFCPAFSRKAPRRFQLQMTGWTITWSVLTRPRRARFLVRGGRGPCRLCWSK